MPLHLKPGRFYRSKDGDIWCCFRTHERSPSHSAHSMADCVMASEGSGRIEYFYLDGRYEARGESPHTLVEDVTDNPEVQDRLLYGGR